MSPLIRRLLWQSIIWLAILMAALFVPAGTLAWPAAWVFFIEFGAASYLMTRWMARHNPALLAERMKPLIQREQKAWDKVLMSAFMALWFAWCILMGLDMRFGWSHMPAWLQAVGAIAIPVAMYIVFLTLRANTFAAPVVKIQAERGHQVVTTGPYAIVRHPMYAGALMQIVAMPLLLGSWWGLAAAPILIVLFSLRAVMEERTLIRELAGYAGYAARVRHRLIPGVW